MRKKPFSKINVVEIDFSLSLPPSRHILPESRRTEQLDPVDMEGLLSTGDPVMLYLHGNALNRGGRHIVDMYKALASIGFHVVAVDLSLIHI